VMAYIQVDVRSFLEPDFDMTGIESKLHCVADKGQCRMEETYTLQTLVNGREEDFVKSENITGGFEIICGIMFDML